MIKTSADEEDQAVLAPRCDRKRSHGDISAISPNTAESLALLVFFDKLLRPYTLSVYGFVFISGTGTL